MTLHNAPGPVVAPVLASGALALAVLVLLGVLFVLAHLHAARRDREDA